MDLEIQKILKNQGFVKTGQDDWFLMTDSEVHTIIKSLMEDGYIYTWKFFDKTEVFKISGMAKSDIEEILMYISQLKKINAKKH